jgi:flavin reductase (DIM6/NTAB) family NADH-FMN oxidoreductase RutF
LNYCGAKSGRNVDKIETTGLIPLLTENESIGFKQARLCLECKKIYFEDLDPGSFLDLEVDAKFYPKKDYHRMYIGEITNCYLK